MGEGVFWSSRILRLYAKGHYKVITKYSHLSFAFGTLGRWVISQYQDPQRVTTVTGFNTVKPSFKWQTSLHVYFGTSRCFVFYENCCGLISDLLRNLKVIRRCVGILQGAHSLRESFCTGWTTAIVCVSEYNWMEISNGTCYLPSNQSSLFQSTWLVVFDGGSSP